MYTTGRDGKGPAAVILVRLLIGWVFVSEGIQKFVFPDSLGVGRFAEIGIPFPEFSAPFVGVVEIVCGALVLIGLATRVACLPLMIDMAVALLSTKIPIALGHGFWGFSLPPLPRYGLFAMAHEARTDVSMFLGALFLAMVGPGAWSVDARIARRCRA